MRRERKSKSEAGRIGSWLKTAREQHGLTMEDVQAATSVNVGQISRFEAGKFIFVSSNLQKILSFLQIEASHNERPEILNRFAELLDRSPRHQAAALALVNALEGLQ